MRVVVSYIDAFDDGVIFWDENALFVPVVGDVVTLMSRARENPQFQGCGRFRVTSRETEYQRVNGSNPPCLEDLCVVNAKVEAIV